MALTLILCLIVVQLLSESTCAYTVYNVKPVCGDSSLQYVFFLVPSRNDFPNLTKFLSTIESATILKTSENEGGIVRILCDPKDWKEIYEYSKNRHIYFLHLAYCMGKSECSTLQQVRLQGNKLGKSTMNKWLNNYLIDKEYKAESRKNTRVIKSLKEFNTDVSTALKNVRILKTRAVNSVMNKNREAGKSQTTQSPTTKVPSRKLSSKNTAKNNKPSSKETSRKSGKKLTTKNQNKTFTRRSIESEIQGSNWLEKAYRRIKRYSWDLSMRNDNAQIRKRRSGKKSSSSKPSGRGKIVSTTPSLRGSDETATTTELSEDDNSTSRSFEDGEKKTIATTNNVTATKSSKRIDETSSQSNNETENSTGATTPGSERENAGEIYCQNDRDDDDHHHRDHHHHHHHHHHHGSKGTDRNMKLGKDAIRLSAPRGDAVTAFVEPGKSKETVSGKQGPVSTSTTEKGDCFSEGSRDSDHSKDYDIDCLDVEPDSLAELADYLQSIFKWVKNLEYRVKSHG